MSTLKVNSIEPANAGSEDYFLARAWVNFKGTGTVAIRADGNVSSITDNGTGVYTANFSSSLSDANYSFNGTLGNRGNATMRAFVLQTTLNEGSTPALMTTSAVKGEASNGSKYDAGMIFIQVTR